MTPYFEQDGVTLYHGDCREVMAGTEKSEAICDVAGAATQRDLVSDPEDAMMVTPNQIINADQSAGEQTGRQSRRNWDSRWAGG